MPDERHDQNSDSCAGLGAGLGRTAWRIDEAGVCLVGEDGLEMLAAVTDIVLDGGVEIGRRYEIPPYFGRAAGRASVSFPAATRLSWIGWTSGLQGVGGQMRPL